MLHAEKHQLFQAYLSEGNLFKSVLQIKHATPFYANTYCEEIEAVIQDFKFDVASTCETLSVTYKGSEYNRGMYVVTRGEPDVVLGRIVSFLVRGKSELFL